MLHFSNINWKLFLLFLCLFLAGFKGPTSKGRGREGGGERGGEGREGKWRGGKGRGREGGKGEGRDGTPPTSKLWLRPCTARYA